MRKRKVLAGGGALLRNLALLLGQATGLPMTIADDPLPCVVLDTGKVLEEMTKLRNVLTTIY